MGRTPRRVLVACRDSVITIGTLVLVASDVEGNADIPPLHMPGLSGELLYDPRHRCDIPYTFRAPTPPPHPTPHLSYGRVHDDTPDEHTRAVRRTVVVARLSPRATSRHLMNVDGKPVKYELARR